MPDVSDELITKLIAWAIAYPEAASALVNGQADVTLTYASPYDEGAYLYSPPPIENPEPSLMSFYDDGFAMLGEIQGWSITHVYDGNDNPLEIWATHKLEDGKRIKIKQARPPVSVNAQTNSTSPPVYWALQEKKGKQWKSISEADAENVLAAINALEAAFKHAA